MTLDARDYTFHYHTFRMVDQFEVVTLDGEILRARIVIGWTLAVHRDTREARQLVFKRVELETAGMGFGEPVATIDANMPERETPRDLSGHRSLDYQQRCDIANHAADAVSRLVDLHVLPVNFEMD